MVSVSRKFYWKQLAPRPYSSLWIWFASRSLKQQSPDYFLPHGLGYTGGNVVYGDDGYDDEDEDNSDDDYYTNGDTYGPLDDGDDNDGSIDWLDSTLASLDNSLLDSSNCVVQSIPVVDQSLQSTVASDQQSSPSKLKVSRAKSKDNKRRKLNSCSNSGENSKDLNESPRKRLPTEGTTITKETDKIEEEPMKILSINESHTLVVLKKNQKRQFSIINGDAKVTLLVGSIVCDGFTLNTEKSVYISTGFGSYQIIIEPIEYQSYPSREHLIEIFDSSQIKLDESTISSILDYLANRDSSLAECVIISFQKWRWPALAALRLYIQPETSFSHWLQVSFSDIKSPVTQWSSMLKRLVQEVKMKTESASARPITKSSTRGPRIIILGGVNAGKSSLTRHICNQIIGSITDKSFIVDCDPGQSEFSPPGIINVVSIKDAILSPPFINCLRFNKDLIASCSVAGTSLHNNPDLYILCVKYLWETFLGSLSDEDSCKPVIINTIGWTQGLGIHLMVDILHIFQPTYVIEIKRQQNWNGKDNFPFDCNPDTLNQLNGWLFHQPLRPTTETIKFSSSLTSNCSLQPYLNYDYIRIINQIVYKKIRRDNRQNRIKNQLAYLCLIDEILFKSLFELEVISLNLENLYFHVQHEFVIDKHLIPHVIKDSWVHLCSISESESDLQSSETNTQPSTSSSLTTPIIIDQPSTSTSSVPPGFTAADANPSLWEPKINFNLKILPFLGENKCYGSAIVRDIDIINKKLILLTPVSPEKMAQINCIVRPQGIFIPEQLQLLGNNDQSLITDDQKVI